jgi:hypothetical protein
MSVRHFVGEQPACDPLLALSQQKVAHGSPARAIMRVRD